jgi:hypothetical protein
MSGDMSGQLVDEEGRGAEGAATGASLDWCDLNPPFDLGDGLRHRDGAAEEVDVLHPKPDGFGPAQAGDAAHQDQCSITRWHCIGRRHQLRRSERGPLPTLRCRQPYARTGQRAMRSASTAAFRTARRTPRFVRVVAGATRADISATAALTC